jgi:hypothetical protein
VRNTTLHTTLESFTCDAAAELSAETARGAEIPFEIVEEPGGSALLYCYRPLTASFIRERLSLLAGLSSYAPAARALGGLDGLDAYLQRLGESRIPAEPRERADAALRCLLSRVFADRSDFGVDPARFEAAYSELEAAVYEGRCVTSVVAPLFGVALDRGTDELALGEGLSLVRGNTLPDAPGEAVWNDREEANVLAVLTVTHDRSMRSPVSSARARFRRLLTALRLFERGGYALGPMAWVRTNTGPWRPVPLATTGRARFVTSIAADQEDELRAFCNLIARRMPAAGELSWALSRFEMGCERLAPFEALSDYLLALRAVLEPEGPSSGRLAGRLAAICARPEDRARVAERTAHAISLERAVIAGLAPAQDGADALVEEMAEHLRAILRDVLCGHLAPDLRGLADELLSDGAVVAA